VTGTARGGANAGCCGVGVEGAARGRRSLSAGRARVLAGAAAAALDSQSACAPCSLTTRAARGARRGARRGAAHAVGVFWGSMKVRCGDVSLFAAPVRRRARERRLLDRPPKGCRRSPPKKRSLLLSAPRRRSAD
jgi:hypothetical protein